MSVVAFTAANIRPLIPNGAVCTPGRAGGTITVGHLVYLAADGDWETADGNVSETEAAALGVATESFDGETTITVGNPVTVCLFGPVAGFEDAVPGSLGYLSDTAGRVDDAFGTFDRIIGWFLSDTILWVAPVLGTPSSA
jgi:hypothetical protein